MPAYPFIKLTRNAAAVALLTTVSAHAAEGADVADPVPLDAVTVTGTAASPYGTQASGTGTKTDTLLIETPQSLSVITAEAMRDQGVQTVQDALRYTAGVMADAYGNDSRGDYSLIRGSDYQSFLDGTRQLAPDFIYIKPDPYQLESVQVLKGPASVLYGQGSSGGLVNLTSKQPQSAAGGELAADYGTFNRRQLKADFTGPLDAGQHWLYRVVAVGRDSGTQVDYVKDNRALLVPSLRWQPDVNTHLTLRATWQYDASGSNSTFPPHIGTVLPNPNGRIPTNRFTSEPGFDRYDTGQAGLAYEFEHRFSPVWALRQNVRFTRARVDYDSMYPNDFSNPDDPFIDANDRVLDRYYFVNKIKTNTLTADNQAEARFATGSLSHTVLFGLDVARLSEDGQTASGLATPIDIYEPTYTGFAAPALSQKPHLQQSQYGFYGQDQIKFGGGWVALAGVRHDKARNATDALEATPASTQDDSATTFRTGLLYHFASGFSPYASYSQSFNPVLGTGAGGEPYKPLRGEQWEGGLKWQPADARTLVTVAAFQIREKNRLTAGSDPFYQVQLGEGQVRGFEVEANQHISKGFDVIGSYTYNRAVVSKSGNADDVGKRIASVPLQQASAWAHYAFPLFDMPGFETGLGVRYVGDSWDGNDTLRTPSATLVDALVGYQQGPWRFAINASNLLDETYETTCLARGDCFIGARRTVVGSLSRRF